MLVFGLGVLIVSMWCMKGTEAGDDDDDDDDEPIIHAVRREDPREGCGSSHPEGGVEECTDEDDSLGLYGDIDDTFKAAVKKVASHFHHDDGGWANMQIEVHSRQYSTMGFIYAYAKMLMA
ncbi:hypothetical protein JHK87_038812 [Glycine soja]|nr:hypothetical protein JHK87_038812 [Glycine soja]